MRNNYLKKIEYLLNKWYKSIVLLWNNIVIHGSLLWFIAAILSLDVLSLLGPVIFWVNIYLHHLFAKNYLKYASFKVAYKKL